MATFLSRPCVHTFVITTARSRLPLSARPSRSSLRPKAVSRECSKKFTPASNASLTIWVAAVSLSAEPRWYPPIPKAETSRPVRPSGRFGISAPDWPCAARPAAPNINASTKVLLVTSNPCGILLRRRERMPAVVCHFEHLAHLNLLHVERKAMSEARLGVVELERQFVKFESAVSRILPATVAQRLQRRWLQRLQTLRYFERLLESLRLINSGNRSSHRQTHRISYAVFCLKKKLLHQRPMTAN